MITLFLLSAIRIGPGLNVVAETDIPAGGSTPTMSVLISDPLLTSNLCGALATWSGAASSPVSVVMGTMNGLSPFAVANHFGVADGGAVSLTVTFQDSTGVIDTQTFTGYLWDPTSGLSYLFALVGGGGGHDPMLDTILAAVQRTF